VKFLISCLCSCLLLSACSGGSNEELGDACTGFCADTELRLTVDDVRLVLAQAITEASGLGVDATIAVTDRVGNVLAVYRMGEAQDRAVKIITDEDGNGGPLISGGLEGIALPTDGVPLNLDGLAAISKSITGAYLSSEGNAFSSRTAGQIIQKNFNPGETNQPSGPLFGVQFSQLSCSDFTVDDNSVTHGPKRSPLGLSADPGGFPLYKNGSPVGGVGVIADGKYSLDQFLSDVDDDVDEQIALAASKGFEAPASIRAERITVEGKTFRYSDARSDSSVGNADVGILSDPLIGVVLAVEGYFDGTLRAGTAFSYSDSGVRQEPVQFPAELDAFVFVDSVSNLNRFPVRNGTDGLLSSADVQTLLENALVIANKSRAQIRRPAGSQARVTISVVDTNGEILGIVRTRDAPVFGADVSLQKARTATFFSSAPAASFLQAQPDAVYFSISDTDFSLAEERRISFNDYLSNLRTFLSDPQALSSGTIAFSDRAGGNLSRPHFPDGIEGEPNGPLSKPPGEWSPFSTGLQLDIAFNAIIQHILYSASSGAVPDVTDQCTGVEFNPEMLSFNQSTISSSLANGIQIFPGSVPIYRGDQLIGGIGVSGDGIDQDDMIAFLSVYETSLLIPSRVNHASKDRRADTLTPQGVRLRYVQCPQAPFLDESTDHVCEGK